jgi:hypothetical protein
MYRQAMFVAVLVLIGVAGFFGYRIYENSRPVVHILFIGNSLTYTNDLPHVITELAAAHQISVETQTVAVGGAGFIDDRHPTVAGTYLAAAVFVSTIFHAHAAGSPALGIPAAEATALQDAVGL